MTVYEYCDTLNLELVVYRIPVQKRWIAQFKDVEIKDGCMLEGVYGEGQSINEAIRDYVRSIRGKRIVVNAMNIDKRREYDVSLDHLDT